MHPAGRGTAAKLVAACVVLTIISLGLASSSAYAHDHWYGTTAQAANPCQPSTGNRIDGGTTWVRYNSLWAINHTSASNAVIDLHLNTTVSVTTTSATWADITFKDGDYSTACGLDWHNDTTNPLGVAGHANCKVVKQSGTWAGACDKSTIRIDVSYADTSLPTFDRRGLMCHELGHSIGLEHEDPRGDCMDQFYPFPDDQLNSDSIAVINANH